MRSYHAAQTALGLAKSPQNWAAKWAKSYQIRWGLVT
jgi:hypothetical protein